VVVVVVVVDVLVEVELELVVVEDGVVVVELPLGLVVVEEDEGAVVVVVEEFELVPGVVVVVDAGTWFETGTTPQGPVVPERCGTANGFEGCPALVVPRLMTATNTTAATPPSTSEPTATGRMAAISRSRLVSLRRRRSSSGLSWVRWASHEVRGAAA
jgi:hypothetical protein